MKIIINKTTAFLSTKNKIHWVTFKATAAKSYGVEQNNYYY